MKDMISTIKSSTIWLLLCVAATALADQASFIQQRGVLYLNSKIPDTQIAGNSQVYLGNSTYFSGLSSAIQNMPPLNQGNGPGCSIFATTEALDILFKGGEDAYNIYGICALGAYLSNEPLNYLDPSLQSYLGEAGYTSLPNPWIGTAVDFVLEQDLVYGLPLGSDSHDQDGTFNDYASLTPQPAIAPNDQSYRWDSPNFTFTDIYNSLNTPSILSGELPSTHVINSLNAGKLVVASIPCDLDYLNNPFLNGCSLAIYPYLNSNQNSYWISSVNTSKMFDTWDSNTSIATDFSNNPSSVMWHGILITGYILSPSYGGGGYFIARNSIGKYYGDNGNYYISFNYLNYFSAMGTEIAKANT